MITRYDESEYVACDLQAIFRYIRHEDEQAAQRFLSAAYDTFEFLADHSLTGRSRGEFGHDGLRSWRVSGFRRYLIFYRVMADRIQIWRVLHGARDLQRELQD